jgi:drug/metabolite transporter (DMT)-like permease
VSAVRPIAADVTGATGTAAGTGPAGGTPRSTPTTTARQHRNAVLMMLFCTLLWSLAGVTTRLLDRAEGFEITFWRSLACAVFVGVVLTVQHGSRWWGRLIDSGAPGLISGVMWAVMFTCFMIALTLTTVANTLVVMSVSPLLAALLGWMVLKERVLPRTWLAIGVAGLGIVWMARHGLSTQGLVGMAIAFGVPVAGAINIVNLKRSGGHVDLVPAVMLGAVISLLATLPVAMPLEAGLHDILILTGLGVFQLGLPCMLMVRAARHLASHEIALLGLLEVVLGPLWAWLGAGEQPAVATMQGGVLVLAALAINAAIGARGRRY